MRIIDGREEFLITFICKSGFRLDNPNESFLLNGPTNLYQFSEGIAVPSPFALPPEFR